MELPAWIDLKTIAEIGLLVAVITQYIKDAVPDYLMKWLVLVIGIGCAYVGQVYQGMPLTHLQTIMNGILAAMVASAGYQVLKNTPLALDSKKK